MRQELEFKESEQAYRITAEFVSINIPAAKVREFLSLPKAKRPSAARKYVDTAMAELELDDEYHETLANLLLACVDQEAIR